ncbi:MAG: murein transglycosylase A, partial [Planktomarina sp.]
KNTCGDMKGDEWSAVCAVADQNMPARAFFETFFTPVLITDDEPALFTGYFEPELEGSKIKQGQFQTPLLSLPDQVAVDGTKPTRQEIDEGAYNGQGLELAWAKNPTDAFFLQVQGSGRVKFQDGIYMRLGYAGNNGHPYKSIGKELIRQGVFAEHEVSAQRIADWVKQNPAPAKILFWHNPSYVFFRVVDHVPADKGPLGAMNRSLTTDRSIAVDPKFTPLGAPVWLEKGGRTPMSRLMVAQDTGSAIKGAQRADIFYGTGAQAGAIAGRVKDMGRMIVLLPNAALQGLTEGQNDAP